VNAPNFITQAKALPHTVVTEGLTKEIETRNILNGRAVMVTTTVLDLDTDGGNAPHIAWDATHQSDTSLHWPHGSPVDSNATRFVVIPLQWGKRHGVKVGDLGLACIEGRFQICGVIVADEGPPHKIGEGSIALHRFFEHETVINGRIKDCDMAGPFTMLIFCGSGDGHCHNNSENESLAWALWDGLQQGGKV